MRSRPGGRARFISEIDAMIAFYRRKDENKVAPVSRDGVSQKVRLVFPGNFMEYGSFNWSVSAHYSKIPGNYASKRIFYPNLTLSRC